MADKSKASPFGLFAAMSLCSVFSLMMWSRYDGAEVSLRALTLVQLAVALLSVLAAFIAAKLRARTLAHSRLFAAIYAVLFTFLAAAELSRFALFLSSFTHLSARFFAYIAALGLLCAAFARKGLASVCRCAVIFLISNTLLDLLGAVMLSFRFSMPAPDIPAAIGELPSAAGTAAAQLIALPAVMFLSADLPKSASKPLLMWSIILPVFSALMCVLSLGALGEYARLVRFPFYTATQTIGFGAFARLDVIFLCARAVGIFIVLSLLFCAAQQAINIVFDVGERRHAVRDRNSSITKDNSREELYKQTEDREVGERRHAVRDRNSSITKDNSREELYKQMEDREVGERRHAVRISLPRAGAVLCAAAVIGSACLAAVSRSFAQVMLDGRLMLAAVAAGVFILPLISLLSSVTVRAKRRLLRAASLLVIASMCVTLLSGCDKVQLQDRMMIKGVGIDEKGGEYLVTVQYINNWSDGSEQENEVLCVSGESISEALGALKDSSGSEPFLGQVSALVIGRETAGRLSELLDYFVRYSEVRPTVRLYISESTALDILSFESAGKLVPIDRVTGITPSSSKNDNRFTMLSMTNELSSKTDTPTAAMLTVNAGALRLFSAGYIDGESVGALDEDEYTAYCLLSDIRSETVLTAGGVSCEVTDCDTRVDAKLDGDRLRFRVTCSPKLSVLEDSAQTGADDVQRLMEAYLEPLLNSAAASLINGSACDIFGFGKALPQSALRSIPTKAEYASLLRTAQTDITVNCRVVEAKALR